MYHNSSYRQWEYIVVSQQLVKKKFINFCFGLVLQCWKLGRKSRWNCYLEKLEMLKFRLAGFDQIVRLCGSSNFFFLLKVKNKPKGSSLETVFEWSVKNFSCFQMLIETTDLPLLFLAVQTAIDTTENNMFSIAFKNGCYSLPFLILSFL